MPSDLHRPTIVPLDDRVEGLLELPPRSPRHLLPTTFAPELDVTFADLEREERQQRTERTRLVGVFLLSFVVTVFLALLAWSLVFHVEH
jgi:hypothetical protein